jgi:hypothetical protein
MNPQQLLKEQLTQVFEYAEILCRLNQAQDLLNPEGGYIGESNIHKSIDNLKVEVYQGFKKHFNNSKVSEQALSLLDEFRSILIKERTGCKYKIGDKICDGFGDYEVISILENKFVNKENEKLIYLCFYDGHNGAYYELLNEETLYNYQNETRHSF